MIEDKPGGPERPLSDLGHRTYVSFWTRRVVNVLLDLDKNQEEISIATIRDRTGMTENDIYYILNHQKILRKDTLCCD
jgi:histone acetyltransferase MYST1